MSRQNPFAAILAGAGLEPRRGRTVVGRTRIRPSLAPASPRPKCTTPCLYERGRCKFCGRPAYGRRKARARGQAPRPRACASEKVVQRDCIALYVAIGCHYSAKDETDIYVLGTRRRRGDHQGTMQTPGICDLWVFLPACAPLAKPGAVTPTCVWHEVKAEDGVPSEAQLRFQQKCFNRGIAHVMGGVDALTAFLIQHGFLVGDRR